MYEGKEIALYVDPSRPEKVSTGTVLGGVILLGMGAVFLLTAVIPAVYSAKKSSARRKLLAEGRCIYATVESISQNMSYAVNGQHPYVIYCTYRDEYKDVTYRFRSENIWTNPEYAVSVGSEIRVYVKDGDYSRYYVDAESILSKKVIDYT
jgi:hypothetical protein